MLLVIGLLGTFLGLGLALNKASSILGQADAMSAGAAADSMSHLMGMLQGLGTKFKTSTWGITGFVLLKIWSEAIRFDEKRLAWVIGKVKVELEKRQRQEIEAEEKNQAILHERIASVAEKVVAGLAEQISKILVLEQEQHGQLLECFDSLCNGQVKLQEEAKQRLLQATEMHQQNLGYFEAMKVGQGELQAEMCASKESMANFSKNMLVVVKDMAAGAERMVEGADKIGGAAIRMEQGADKVGEAAKGLVGAVGEFQAQFTDVLNNVRRDLGDAIQNMSKQAAGTLEKGSAQLSEATMEISTALGVLSADVKNTMNEVKDSIGDALRIQRKASDEFTLSSRALNENIEVTTSTVGKLAKPIEDGLRAVSDSGQHMRSVGRALDNSLGAMQLVLDRLESAPDPLKLLGHFHDWHRDVISALDPLRQMPGNQQKIIQEVSGLRNDFFKQQMPLNLDPVDQVAQVGP